VLPQEPQERGRLEQVQEVVGVPVRVTLVLAPEQVQGLGLGLGLV